MIVGVGTDIVAIERMARLYARYGRRFAERVLGSLECADLPADSTAVAAFLARRFAAKEATYKALGSGLGAGMRWSDVQVTHDAAGRPQLLMEGKSAELLRQRGREMRTWVSISDERRYATAVVILESGV
ncbi:4'-phosphopantetheinyl transferase [Acidithiobacillus marinus]|uniref:Holo-[acyl-carrier-protein] synthase n=1 Tax=Acidithiobacillus marinus TaxID=187490 RepID=A0A2I1DJE8_9PROT|nr:holo-ACP synthase [Acidithiobacillus marinus]PKY10000.1 4'-phosphopantetheinyl transferase [Acidithiobacillus marinus]